MECGNGNLGTTKSRWTVDLVKPSFSDARFLNTDTSLLRTVWFVPGERKPFYFSKFNPLNGTCPLSVTLSNRIRLLWFNFILGLIIIFCFKLIIIHYHTQKRKKIKFKPSLKLNPNTYTQVGPANLKLSDQPSFEI